MQAIVKIPESYRDYITDRTIESVVEHLLTQKDNDLPIELGWNELYAYHQAWLSAQKVKTDYALFVMDLWEIAWGNCLRKYGIIHEHTIDEVRAWDMRPTRDSLWENGCCRYFSFNSFELDIQAMAYSDVGVCLRFKVDDQEGNVFSEKMESLMSVNWKREEEYLVTQKWILIQDAPSELDVSKLQDWADEVISVFINRVSQP